MEGGPFLANFEAHHYLLTPYSRLKILRQHMSDLLPRGTYDRVLYLGGCRRVSPHLGFPQTIVRKRTPTPGITSVNGDAVIGRSLDLVKAGRARGFGRRDHDIP